jgi:hypothetical protein
MQCHDAEMDEMSTVLYEDATVTMMMQMLVMLV